jgi:hypothetical protein
MCQRFDMTENLLFFLQNILELNKASVLGHEPAVLLYSENSASSLYTRWFGWAKNLYSANAQIRELVLATKNCL